MSSREEAIKGIKNYYQKFGEKGKDIMIVEILRRVGDMDLLALYYDLYGHAVGEKEESK